MTKLSDTQTVLLSSAAQRPNGSLLPLPTSIAGGTRLAKPISGLVIRGLVEQRATADPAEVHRSDDERGFGLFITAAGEAAIGVEKATEVQPVPAETTGPGPSPTPRRTKADLVLGLLAREGGATMAELIAATGWLPHTTRAALTGLRKKGHDVRRGKRDDETCYSVAAAPAGVR